MIATWPVDQETREKLVSNNAVPVDIPVTLPDGTEVDPKLYKETLCGAIATVYFTLSHFPWTGKKESAFTPTIQEIKVHRLPVAIVATPSRLAKRTPPKDNDAGPSSGSPIKRMRV